MIDYISSQLVKIQQSLYDEYNLEPSQEIRISSIKKSAAIRLIPNYYDPIHFTIKIQELECMLHISDQFHPDSTSHRLPSTLYDFSSRDGALAFQLADHYSSHIIALESKTENIETIRKYTRRFRLEDQVSIRKTDLLKYRFLDTGSYAVLALHPEKKAIDYMINNLKQTDNQPEYLVIMPWFYSSIDKERLLENAKPSEKIITSRQLDQVIKTSAFLTDPFNVSKKQIGIKAADILDTLRRITLQDIGYDTRQYTFTHLGNPFNRIIYARNNSS